MRDKAAARRGRSVEDRAELCARICRDLERMGVAPEFSEGVARRLAPTVAKLSPHEVGAVLASVAAAYGERGQGADLAGDDIADVQRLMQGFSEEVQKLDEGLRMLSAYVSRLRERGTRSAGERLH